MLTPMPMKLNSALFAAAMLTVFHADARAENGAQRPWPASANPVTVDADFGPTMSLYADDAALLRKIVVIATNRSPQLREANSAARAAQFDVDEAKGARWPKLEMSASSRAASFGATNNNADRSTGRIGLTATYNLFDAGRTSSQIKAREFTQQSMTDRLAQAREAVVFETVNAYLQIIKQRRTADLYKHHIDRLGLLVKKLELVVAVFVGRRSELTQANVRLGQARDGLDIALSREREGKNALVRLLGADDLIPPLARDVPHYARAPVLEELVSMLDRHPQLHAELADTQSAKEAVHVASASRLPQLDLEATKLSGRDTYGNSAPGQTYLAVRWTAFQGFAGQAAQGAAIERANAAEERYAQTRIDIEYRLRSAWADYQTNLERTKSLSALALATNQVRQDYYVQWNDLGKRSLLEVLIAENDHLSTLLSLSDSEVDAETAALRLRFEGGSLSASLLGPSPLPRSAE
jgi:adhesin transport system outer membrane protein